MMQTLSKRDKTLLLVMGIVVLLAVFLVMTPSGGASGPKNMLPLDEATAKNVKTKLKYRDLLAEKDRLEPQIKRITYNMAPEQLTAYITEDLYALADRAGVHIREIKPLRSRTLPDGSVTRVPLEVRFNAPFQPNVMRFLYFAEDPTKKMVVDKFSITSTDAHLKTVDVTAQITVYTRSAIGAAGAGEGDTSESTNTPSRG